jgi:DNA-directed RNA polymerase subunit beta
VKKFFEKPNPHVSNVILKKKSLRRSILPLKTGHLFFEPTPQMIFKNILSKNTKKREILRKAFLQKAFIPYQVDSEGANEVSSNSHQSGSSGRVLKSAGCPRSKVSWSVSMKKVTPYTQMTYTIQGYWRTNQNTLRRQRPAVQAGDWVAAGDLLAESSATLRGELCVGQNILVGYVPWEGYNFEDAIVVNERLVEEDIYTSILIDRYEMEAAIDAGEKITRKIPDLKPHVLKNLDLRGIICVGTWVEEDDILVGKILPVTTELQGYSKLLADIYQIAPPVAKDVSFRVPDRVSGRVLECSVSEMIVRTPNNQSFATPWKVTLYLVEKRRMKLGDKMSGRHGNKGIVSIILPPQDMPFLPDGTPLDVALNPLGVPSRMNVGQLLESLLGLAGKHLHQKYRIPAFDEMYGEDFSRRIVYDKLLEASQKTQKPWLFNPNFPGKMMLRDGRTGDYFHQPILVGYPYMLKLIHMVDDKMHARATGPYTMVTQQPLKGRANRGGQRIGEMEVWAVEAFAASYALQELLTLKSDDMSGRNHFLMSFLKRKKRTVGGIPDAFRVLMHELQSLCFHVHYTEDYRLTYPTLLESSQIPETPIPGNYGRGG